MLALGSERPTIEEDLEDQSTLRAYLAQRPDEETVRKGRAALLSLAAWARARSDWSHQRNAVHDEETAVLAAMYQPEEEA